MAGLWERVKPTGADRINVHLIVASLKGFSAGIFTAVQVRDALNNHIANPLTTEEQADLTAISNQITGTATVKLTYVVGKLEPLMIAAESGDVTESFWRTNLGI